MGRPISVDERSTATDLQVRIADPHREDEVR
jgi:hypothetical protein